MSDFGSMGMDLCTASYLSAVFARRAPGFVMLETKSLGDYFFKGAKQNGSLWRNYCKATQMAKWIGDAREAQQLSDEADAETIETLVAPRRWKSLTLQQLFGGAEKPRTRKPSA
ncbi:hypothetical protein C8R44DRAFT_755165 [Mycena epipterygia]|nr:hypothetical protein C8R44DRAFT_755410 [Mycena epipterygia]KAJ7077582.1 hypothetical protein C8R44DRAFT_755165 [Mycena epipterygia]